MSSHLLTSASALSALLVATLLAVGRAEDAAPVIALLSLALMVSHHRIQAGYYSMPSSDSTRSRMSSGIQASLSVMKSSSPDSSPHSRQ